jgi:hypothetical protein
MNPPSNHSPLLADVLAETESRDDFRASLLGTTLTLVRRRQRRRQIGQVAVVGIAAGLFAALIWSRTGAPQTAIVKTWRGHTPVVASRPLLRAAIVVTVPLRPEQALTTYASVAIIETRPDSTPLRMIDDRELLALAAPYPVALVRVGPQSEELLFLNPKDQAELVR